MTIRKKKVTTKMYILLIYVFFVARKTKLNTITKEKENKEK